MFSEHHPLSSLGEQTKIVWNLTLVQLIAISVGGKLSYEFAQVVPPLPIKNFIFAHIHHLIPLLITYLLVSAKEVKTGLPLWKYVYNWFVQKFTKDIYVWKKIS